jgi:hypothetical protein
MTNIQHQTGRSATQRLGILLDMPTSTGTTNGGNRITNTMQVSPGALVSPTPVMVDSSTVRTAQVRQCITPGSHEDSAPGQFKAFTCRVSQWAEMHPGQAALVLLGTWLLLSGERNKR